MMQCFCVNLHKSAYISVAVVQCILSDSALLLPFLCLGMASLPFPVGDITDAERRRLCQAEEFLSDINRCLHARGGDQLVPAHVDGDGYCLFRCLSWACLGDDSTEMARKLYAYALSVFMKDASKHIAYANDLDEGMLSSLMSVEEYCASLPICTPLDIAILCKFEALLSEREVLDENLYGDAYEFVSLLEAVGLRVLRLDVTNNACHQLLTD